MGRTYGYILKEVQLDDTHLHMEGVMEFWNRGTTFRGYPSINGLFGLYSTWLFRIRDI